MSDQWSSNPGGAPPTPPSVPAGWAVTTAPTQPPSYGAGPPMPPLPQPYERKPPSRTALVIASMALVILILVVGLAFVSFRKSDDTATAPTTTTSPSTSTTKKPATTTTPSTAPSTPSTVTPPSTTPRPPVTTAPPGPAPTQAEVDAVVKELSAFVEKERGLTFKTPVKVELAADEAFNQRLLAKFDEDKADIEREGKLLKALGLIDPGVNVVEALRTSLGAGVLGFYDPETKELVVRGQALTPYIKQTMAHELVHAIDDQYFDLNRKDLDDKKDESAFGFQATVEGNARRIEAVYENQMSPADKKARDTEEASYAFAAGDALKDVPPILLSLLSVPYDVGQPFTTAVVKEGGNDLLASAFTTPAPTSTQILHPQKFFTHVAPVEVAKPKAEGKEIDDRMFGEMMTTMTLNDGAPAEAAKAGDGWAGDWYVLWDDGKNGSCVRIDYKMATPKDLDELEQAFKTWQKKHKGADIQRKDGGLEVTSCSSAAAGGGRSPA